LQVLKYGPDKDVRPRLIILSYQQESQSTRNIVRTLDSKEHTAMESQGLQRPKN